MNEWIDMVVAGQHEQHHADGNLTSTQNQTYWVPPTHPPTKWSCPMHHHKKREQWECLILLLLVSCYGRVEIQIEIEMKMKMKYLVATNKQGKGLR